MQRVFIPEVGRVEVVEGAVPTPPPGHALVRTLAAGICGSDTHALAGQHSLLPPPYYPGHEVVGVVEQQPSDGSGPGVGSRVLLKPNVPCGECVNCRDQRSNACQTLAWVGCDPSGKLPGGMADFFTAPAGNLYELPEHISLEQAALIECLATPVHAARIAGDLTGARVVVMGAGTIGVLMLQAARHAGAERIVVTDLDDYKLERALALGADGVVMASDPDFATQATDSLGGPADFIFDCVAMEASARQWPSLVRRAATVCIVGVPPRSFAVPMPLVQDWELRVQGCAAYTEADIETAISMAADIAADQIVTAAFTFAAAAEAFEVASQSSSGKVLLTPEKVAS